MNESNLVKVGGNTYPVKEQLKSQCGARWNGADKCWMVRADKAELAASIVSGAPAQKVAKRPASPVSMAAIVWSDEQAKIVEWFKTSMVAGQKAQNLVVRARAGSGKTFTIIGGIVSIPEASGLYAVFGSKNRDEAVERITDPRITVLSLHQCGFRFGIKRHWPKSRMDGQVEWDRIDSAAGEMPGEVRSEIFRLVGFAKNCFLGLPSQEQMEDLAEARLIDCENYEQPEDGGWTLGRVSEVAIEVLKLSMVPDSINRISFNDMVWLPIAMNWIRPSFPIVIVDEAQDMNAPQLEIARRLSSDRVAVVGDDRQAIFGFRGAVQDGIDMMKRELNAEELGLTYTKRCGKSIVSEANKLVPDFKSTEDSHEGLVDEIREPELMELARGGDAILSRTNAPLMPVCLSFIRRGIGCRIEGKDVGSQLLTIINKLKARSIPEVIRKASAWGQRMIARLHGSDEKKDARLNLINDQVETIVALVEGLGSVNEIEARVKAIFSDSDDASNQRNNAIVCSTVHKAKGLEWNRVFVLGSTFKRSGREEDNIYYVAITRAKKHLTYVGGRRNLSGR